MFIENRVIRARLLKGEALGVGLQEKIKIATEAVNERANEFMELAKKSKFIIEIDKGEVAVRERAIFESRAGAMQIIKIHVNKECIYNGKEGYTLEAYFKLMFLMSEKEVEFSSKNGLPIDNTACIMRMKSVEIKKGEHTRMMIDTDREIELHTRGREIFEIENIISEIINHANEMCGKDDSYGANMIRTLNYEGIVVKYRLFGR